MRRTEQTYYTGRESDGSDRVEHRRVQWLEMYNGIEYVVQEQLDPPVVNTVDGLVAKYTADPTPAEALAAAVRQDAGLALLVKVAKALGV